MQRRLSAIMSADVVSYSRLMAADEEGTLARLKAHREELLEPTIAKHQGRNRDELKVFRRTDRPCPRCRTKIRRIIVGQRSTHICPKCQKTEDKNLTDV